MEEKRSAVYFVRVWQFFRELALVQEEVLACHNNSREPKTVSAENLGAAFFLFCELFETFRNNSFSNKLHF